MQSLNPDITLLQKEIILGTILGGSSIVKPAKGRNCYLSMRGRDSHWLEYKAVQLKAIAADAPFTLPKTGGTYRWHSCCYPFLSEYRNEFYTKKGRRSLHQSSLDPLRDWGLAVWFVDCGRFDGNEIVMNTNVWGKRGTATACIYFRSLGYEAYSFQERGGWRLKLDEYSSQCFLKIITAPIPIFVKRIMSQP